MILKPMSAAPPVSTFCLFGAFRHSLRVIIYDEGKGKENKGGEKVCTD